MPYWLDLIRSLAPDPLITGQRLPDQAPDDEHDPVDDDTGSGGDEDSRRIVEEAIRRLEEAEHEWSRSWEPDKSTE
jgi:hypothetical protein